MTRGARKATSLDLEGRKSILETTPAANMEQLVSPFAPGAGM
jgi:hypothetical protein